MTLPTKEFWTPFRIITAVLAVFGVICFYSTWNPAWIAWFALFGGLFLFLLVDRTY